MFWMSCFDEWENKRIKYLTIKSLYTHTYMYKYTLYHIMKSEANKHNDLPTPMLILL